MPTFREVKTQTFLAENPPPAALAGKPQIKAIQCRLAKEKEYLAQVTAKIAEREKEIATLESSMPPLPTFNVSRESLLADIDLGEATIDDLVKFDKEVFDAQKKYTATVRSIEAKIATPKSALAGLKKRAAKADRRIEDLNAEEKRLRIEHYRAEAEAAGEEYVRLTYEVRRIAVVVAAYGGLLKQIGFLNTIADQIGAIDIRPLDVDSTHNKTPFFSSNELTPLIDAEQERILAELAAEGSAVPSPETAPAPPKKGKEPEPGTVRSKIWRSEDYPVLPTHAITEE